MSSIRKKKVSFSAPLSDAEREFNRIEEYWEQFSSDSDASRSERKLKSSVIIPIVNERGAIGNKSSPNKRSSPKRPSYRDTLNGRLRKRRGKPGSRKHRKWVNELNLGRREDELSDTGPLEDELEDYLFDGIKESVFFQLFEDQELYDSFQRFFDITEEEERILLELDTESDSEDEDPIDFTDPSFAYQRISTRGKRSISKYFDTEFFQELDYTIFNFVQSIEYASPNSTFTAYFPSTTEKRLQLIMKDSFHRLIAHNICNYYNVLSQSEISRHGHKTIFVTRPEDLLGTPSKRLGEYLEMADPCELLKSKSKKSSKHSRRKQARTSMYAFR